DLQAEAFRCRVGDVLHPIARLPDEWAGALAAHGERPFRAKEVFAWIHRRSVLDPASMTSLPGRLRDALAREGLGAVATAARVHASVDGTRKVVVRLADGATIETVLLPAVSGPGSAAALDADAAAVDDSDEDEDENERETTTRVTQCISTQVGCAM